MSITDIGYLQEVARLLRDSGLTRVDINDGGMRVVMERGAEVSSVVTRDDATMAAPVNDSPAPEQPAANDVIDFNSVYEVKSPLVGVFYTAPSPDEEPFVRIGDDVRKGDVLCIVEAMKLMNEITAERDGRIVDICIKNGDVAEYGQVLFKLT